MKHIASVSFGKDSLCMLIRLIETGAPLDECMRVLDAYGVLIFKWCEDQIPVSKILNAIGAAPLFGHKSGRTGKTHWLCFMKIPTEEATNDNS